MYQSLSLLISTVCTSRMRSLWQMRHDEIIDIRGLEYLVSSQGILSSNPSFNLHVTMKKNDKNDLTLTCSRMNFIFILA